MISIDNKPIRSISTDNDFTLNNYRQLIKLAKEKYEPASYKGIPFGRKFVLWRHDCDYSLNRSLSLAKIEHEEGIRATYFLNPHCEFYNPLESGQAQIVKSILGLGHDIGLHFDAAFYATESEAQLNDQVKQEAQLLEQVFGVRMSAFSFHNPSAFHLTCEAEIYGGLINCYSKRFKTKIPYCSDSNGYWRFRRLHDVFEQATDPCLQVLTHPGWWQNKPMPPRQRIYRCAYGRAEAAMRQYDNGLEQMGRETH